MLKKLVVQVSSIVDKLEFFPPLVIRLIIGIIFFQSGLGKFSNLSGVIEFFTSLGIPFARIQAPFVAGVELVGGACLIVGFLTRLVSIPLACTMIVALLTAKREVLGSFSMLTDTSEFLYLLLLLSLTGLGSGAISVDYFVFRKNRSQNS